MRVINYMGSSMTSIGSYRVDAVGKRVKRNEA